ncbi:MAG: 30S ribosomal protein S16 [Chloroflexota bacterium]|nr:30S ribosomal protein S16 [Chloroflexota bacterium]
MAVRIRLTRVGATKRPAYRVIAIDKRRSRDGRALEILGYYDPLTEPATVNLDRERIDAWIGKGAQPSDTVAKLMRQAEKAAQAPVEAEKPKRASRATKPKAAKATAKAKPEPEAPTPGEETGDAAQSAEAAPAADAAAEASTDATVEPEKAGA